MKKRIISLLLTVLMVAGMFTGFTVSASADYDKSNMIAYTMKSGDNVYTVCRSKGIDFYANYDLITAVNSIRSYSAIAPGTVIYLPKPGVTYVDESTTGTTTGTTGSTTATNTSVSASGVTIPAGDYVAYYLVPYKMQSGDTVYNVCRSLGISFNTYSEQIKTINGLKNYSSIAAGTTLLLPSTTAPSNTSGAYKVMAHKIASGETVSGIMSSYKMDYNSNAEMLKKLNNKSNLGNIQAGKLLYIAVPATVSGGTGSTGSTTGTTTGSTSSSSGTTGSTTGSTTTTTTYAINAQTVTNGSFTCQVDGKAVTKAAAGETVTVVAKANSGCSVESIVVTKTSNGASVSVSKDNTFVMPSCQVNVKVNFTSEHRIYINNNGNGEAGSTINGVLKFWASKGQTVGLKTESHKGYYVKSWTVTNNKTGAQIPTSNGTFTMPDNDVTVDVYFVKSDSKSYYIRHDTGKGNFETTVNGIAVDVVRPGDTVTVVATPGSGKEIDTVSYWRDDNKQTYKLTKTTSFKMPECDVAVSVTFKDKTSYSLTVNSSEGGSAVLQVGGKNVTGATEGAVVTVVPTAKNGYHVKKVTVTPKGGSAKDITESLSFKMTAAKATVEVTFEKDKTYNITITTSTGVGSVKALVNGTKVIKAAAGSLVEIEATPAEDYKLDTVKVTDLSTNYNLKGYTADSLQFIMPAADVKIDVGFKSAAYAISIKSNVDGCTANALIDGVKAAKAAEGDLVKLDIKPAESYRLDSVNVIDASTGNTLKGYIADSTQFTMPAAGVIVDLKFVVGNYTVDTVQAANGTITAMQNNKAITEAQGDTTVYVQIKPNKNYTVEDVYFTYMENGEEQRVDLTKNLDKDTNITYFTMRKADVVIYVKYKAGSFGIANSCSANLSADNITVDGEPATSAVPGTVVRVVPTPAAGWSYTTKVVKKNDNSVVVARKSNGEFTFTMPDFAVEIVMEVEPNTLTLKTNGNSSNFNASNITVEDGYFSKVSDTEVRVTPGASVVAEPVYYDEGWVYEMVITKTETGAVLYKSTDKPLTFTMPDYPVTIEVTYAK